MSIEADLQRSFGIDAIDPAQVLQISNSLPVASMTGTRIAITGASSTGISTVARNLARALSLPLISEVARAVFEHGFKPASQGSMESQATIWFAQHALEQATDSFVADRFPLCALAHAEVLAEGSESEQNRTFIAAMSNATARVIGNYSAIFYTPIEFGLVKDGIRDEDQEFRSRLDQKILELFARFNLDFHTLKGTPEDRHSTAMQILADNEICVDNNRN